MGKGDRPRRTRREKKVMLENKVLYLPGTPEYTSSLEKLYGKPGVPEGFSAPLGNPAARVVVDLLGRPLSEDDQFEINQESTVLTNPKEKDFPVTLLRDSNLKMPELWLSVYIHGPDIDAYGFPLMFSRARCTAAKDADEADLVVFTGGPDVNPTWYGAKPHPRSNWDDNRDDSDFEMYNYCEAKGIPMLGICRGAQFLHVMNGGTLYQHVENHGRGHAMFDRRQQLRLENVSSTHHQMCMDNPLVGPDGEKRMEVIAHSGKMGLKYVEEHTIHEGDVDIEVYFYRDTCCIGIQGHPEYRGYDKFTQWSLELIQHCICDNPDVSIIDHRSRLRPEIVEERQMYMAETVQLVVPAKAL